MLVMVVPAGIPFPLICSPTFRPTVEETTTEVLPLVVEASNVVVEEPKASEFEAEIVGAMDI